MTMPSKIWIRSRVPSTTLACTLTVSPGIKVGTFLRWDSASSRLMTLDTAYKDITLDPRLPPLVEQVRTATAGPFGGLGAAPALDLRMVAPAQHLGNAEAFGFGGGGGRVAGPFAGARPPRLEDGPGLQHHAGAAAIGNVVDLPVAIVRVVAQVMDPQRDEPAGQAPPSDPRGQGPRKHLREEREDIDDHARVSSGRSTVILPSAGAIERTTLRIMGIKSS